MHQPVKGSFVPWSDEPRVCPGKRFAQVEFVAVIARLFHRQRVHPVPESGEDSAAARERTLDVVKDSHMTFLLQMRDPSRVSLAWTTK
jgi:cytochrome P450